MASAKKLPSGKWRVLVFDYTDNTGKRHYKSFTANTKRQAELDAAQYCSLTHRHSNGADMFFGDAVQLYISQRSAILSPATVREYRGIARRYLDDLKGKRLNDITQQDIQTEVNILSGKLSPKSVKNIHGLISAVLAAYRPDFALRTLLPKKVPPKLYVPSEGDVRTLMGMVKDTPLELPVLLAAFGPMRRGEICALRVENITRNIVHVCENMVLNENGEWVIKAPKSYAGDRYIEYPEFVSEKWKDVKSGRITQLYPQQLTDRFDNVLKRAGLPHFRFHDLRHYSASIQHAIGVPDAYIMQRGGWANDGVLKNVYRHVMEDQAAKMTRMTNEHFSNMQHEMQHEKEKTP